MGKYPNKQAGNMHERCYKQNVLQRNQVTWTYTPDDKMNVNKVRNTYIK